MSKEKRQDQRARLQRTLINLGTEAADDQLYLELQARYAEPLRHYHTITHVLDCLTWLDKCQMEASHPAEVEVALWFHDAVYDPRSRNNEEESASLAMQRLCELGVGPEVSERVAALIMATQTHESIEGDAALVVSVDLAILASTPEKYRAFEQQIRRENPHVPESVYRVARGQVLQRFLKRQVIFPVDWYRERLETAARANLKRRIRDRV